MKDPQLTVRGKAALDTELDRALSEKAWLNEVLKYAKERGWLVAHFRPARTKIGWRTPMQGDPGFPDLVLARVFPSGQSIVLALELKSASGRITTAQEIWIDTFARAAGVFASVIYPKDRASLFSLLSGTYDTIITWKRNASLAGNHLG